MKLTLRWILTDERSPHLKKFAHPWYGIYYCNSI